MNLKTFTIFYDVLNLLSQHEVRGCRFLFAWITAMLSDSFLSPLPPFSACLALNTDEPKARHLIQVKEMGGFEIVEIFRHVCPILFQRRQVLTGRLLVRHFFDVI